MKPATVRRSAWTFLVRCSWRLLMLVGLAGIGVLLLGSPANAACSDPSCEPKRNLVEGLLDTVSGVVAPTVGLLQPKDSTTPSPAVPPPTANPAVATPAVSIPAVSTPAVSSPAPTRVPATPSAASSVAASLTGGSGSETRQVLAPVVDLSVAVVGVVADEVTEGVLPDLAATVSTVAADDAVLAVPGVLALPLAPGARQAGSALHELAAGASETLVSGLTRLTSDIVGDTQEAVTAVVRGVVSPAVAPVDNALGSVLGPRGSSPGTGSPPTPSGTTQPGSTPESTLSPAWSVPTASVTPAAASHARAGLGAGRDVAAPVPPPDQAVEPTSGLFGLGSTIPGSLPHNQAGHLLGASGSSSVAGSSGGPAAPGASDLGSTVPGALPASHEDPPTPALAPAARFASAPDEEPPTSPD